MEKRPEFLDPRTLAKLEGLRLRAQHIVEGYVAGLHRSPLRGFSIEFSEHREYSPGDDLRHVDWKVFGRTDKFYLKQYEDETNLICYIALDVSESMSYRSSPELLSKLEYAQCLAAALSWLVIGQQDAVGLMTFDREVRSLVRPASSPSHLRSVLQVMEKVSAEKKTDTGRVFHEFAQRLTKRGVVIVIGDLFDDVQPLIRGLRHLRHRRHDVIVFHVLDPAELDFPFRRTTLFKGLEELPEVLTDPRSLRKAYLGEFQKFLGQIENGCRSAQVDYLMLRTDQSFEVPLTRYLSQRMARSM